MKFKKFLAIILTVICVFSPLTVAFAADEVTPDCPYIYVHGFMAKDIYFEKNNRDSGVAWPPSSDNILELVKACLPALLSFLVTKDYDALADAIIDPCKKALGNANLDTDGNASDGSGIIFSYPDKNSITKTSYLDFNYDWRLDPVELASQLNDFINYVLDASGCEQVVLECHSFGGVVTEAYTAIYGSSKLKSVCYNSSAVFGETYTGELLTGKITVSDVALTAYLKDLVGDNEYSKLLDGIFDLLLKSGFTGDLSSLANGIIENIGTIAIKEVLLPMFCGWLSIWAMVPDESIDEAVKYVFEDLYEGDIAGHQGLYDKITYYNKNIRPYKADVLKQQNEVSNMYVISRYGRVSVPLTPSWATMCDSVVDTHATSFGAYCSAVNASFSESFIKEHANDALMSPDGKIYAADCLFPEQTWFIKGLEHSKSPDSLEKLAYDLLYFDGQATVDTFDEYPRFMVYNFNDGTLTPDDGNSDDKMTILDKIFKFVLDIIGFFRNILDKIF